jgi:hypothetical protein
VDKSIYRFFCIPYFTAVVLAWLYFVAHSFAATAIAGCGAEFYSGGNGTEKAS